MRINKILNNNSVVVIENGVEKIVLGSGIAFQKKRNDIIAENKIEKTFVLKEESEKFQELLKSLPESYISVAEDIITYAEGKLGLTLNSHIHIALTDHLSFAIERIKSGIPLRNRLLNEIKSLYREEYEIGIWAIEEVQNRLGIHLPIDEAAYIALHIHTASMNENNLDVSLKKTMLIQELMDIVSSFLNIVIDKENFSYQRFITHLEFVISRLEKEESFHDMDNDMLEMIKLKYKESFGCAVKIAHYLKQEYTIDFPEAEIGYITLHIQRLYDKSK